MSEQCAARTKGGWYGSPCTRKGTAQEGGKWWCRQHTPSIVSVKQDERDRRREEKWAREDQQRDEAKAARKEIGRRADCFDDLLAALEETRDELKRVHGQLSEGKGIDVWGLSGLPMLIGQLQGAIAKAKLPA